MQIQSSSLLLYLLFFFLQNLDALHDHLGTLYPGMKAPSFRCTERPEDGALVLHYYSDRPGLEHIVIGIVKVCFTFVCYNKKKKYVYTKTINNNNHKQKGKKMKIEISSCQKFFTIFKIKNFRLLRKSYMERILICKY